jgi:type IV pilus assembly protein PilM
MFKSNTAIPFPIGLDIGYDSIKLLQLQLQGKTLGVRASARRQLNGSNPTPSAMISPEAAREIRQLIRGGAFAGRSVVTTLPRQIVHMKNIRLPQMPASDIAAVVQFEAQNIFPFASDGACVRFLLAGEVRHGAELRQEVIVIAARNDDVDRYIEQLHDLGLIIESLEAEPCALYRGIERAVRRREDEQEIHVLLDVGTRATQVLIGKGRDITFFKSIDLGGGSLNLAVSRKLGIGLAEARMLRRRLWTGQDAQKRDSVRQAVFDATRSTMESIAREIALCLRYHSVTFRGQRTSRVRLLGGEGGDPQLLGILNSTLAVKAEAGRPLLGLDCSAMHGFNPTAPSGDWALAFGLGLKRVPGTYTSLDGTPRKQSAVLDPLSPERSAMESTAPNPAPGRVELAPPIKIPPQDDHFVAIRRASVAMEETHV